LEGYDSLAVKRVLNSMPEQVKEVMEAAKQSETFEAIKVSGVRQRGDPMLVGVAGGRNFLLAMWCNLDGGYSIGATTAKLI